MTIESLTRSRSDGYNHRGQEMGTPLPVPEMLPATSIDYRGKAFVESEFRGADQIDDRQMALLLPVADPPELLRKESR